MLALDGFKFGVELEFHKINDKDKYEYEVSSLNIPRGLRYCSDGTVRGGEIKNVRPERYGSVLLPFQQLFQQNTFEIDEGCSFHIHVSHEDVDFSECEVQFQRRALAYIGNNLSQVPSGVLERWLGSMRYFNYVTGKGRYYFVAHRVSVPGYNEKNEYRYSNTYEFRCWGNVGNMEEAQTCLDITVAAVRYANDGQNGNLKLLTLNEFVQAVRGELDSRQMRRAG